MESACSLMRDPRDVHRAFLLINTMHAVVEKIKPIASWLDDCVPTTAEGADRIIMEQIVEYARVCTPEPLGNRII